MGQTQTHDINRGLMQPLPHQHFQLRKSQSTPSPHAFSLVPIIPWQTICSFLTARDILMLHHTHHHIYRMTTHSRDDMMMWKNIYYQQHHWLFPLDTLYLVTGESAQSHLYPSTCCWYDACSTRARNESSPYMSSTLRTLKQQSLTPSTYHYTRVDRMIVGIYVLIWMLIWWLGLFQPFSLFSRSTFHPFSSCTSKRRPWWCWYINRLFISGVPSIILFIIMSIGLCLIVLILFGVAPWHPSDEQRRAQHLDYIQTNIIPRIHEIQRRMYVLQQKDMGVDSSNVEFGRTETNRDDMYMRHPATRARLI